VPISSSSLASPSLKLIVSPSMDSSSLRGQQPCLAFDTAHSLDTIAAVTALGEQYFLEASTGSGHLQGKAKILHEEEPSKTLQQQVAILGQQVADWLAAAVPGSNLLQEPEEPQQKGRRTISHEWLCLGDEDLPQQPVRAKRIPQGRRSFSNDWLCLADEDPPQRQVPQKVRPARPPRVDQRERLVSDLFQLHDLNGNGFLEEEELVKLNEKIAMLHSGPLIDKQAVRSKYIELFRTKLDSQGKPVPYSTFRSYMFQVLQKADPDDLRAQEMILEQFIAEAQSGIEAFRFNSFHSVTDVPYLAKMSFAGPHTLKGF